MQTPIDPVMCLNRLINTSPDVSSVKPDSVVLELPFYRESTNSLIPM